MSNMSNDKGYLASLAVAHYVVGGIGVCFACIPLLHLVMGIALVTGNLQSHAAQSPPDAFGWIFVAAGAVFFLIGQAIAVTIIVSGRFLAKQKHYMFSFIIACIMCAFFPFGTILGVFTIIVLSRDNVKRIYGRLNEEPTDTATPPQNP